MSGGMAFFCSIPYLHPARTPYTLELLAATQRLANFCHMRMKQALASRRPNEYSPQVQPMILTPSHSTFPSGHATEAFMAAAVLWRLLQAAGPPSPTATTGTKPYQLMGWLEQLIRLANRIAVNRTIAGVHFPVDSAAGCVLGLTLGYYFVARCATTTGSGATNVPYDAYKFDGSNFPQGTAAMADGDFYWTLYIDPANGNILTQPPYVTRLNSTALTVQYSALLNWLWGKALEEWT
jgi:hypothetical protein